MGVFDDLPDVKRQAANAGREDSMAKESAVLEFRRDIEKVRSEYAEVLGEFCLKTDWTFSESTCDAHWHDVFGAQGSFELCLLGDSNRECHVSVHGRSSSLLGLKLTPVFGTSISARIIGNLPGAGRGLYHREYSGASSVELGSSLREMYARVHST